jgi:pseudouridine kinase
MGAGHVLVIGGANLDIVAHAAQPLRTADSTPGSVHFSPGGVARNVAHNLALLGHDVRLVSAVGDDAPGHALRAATQAAGVDVSACLALPGAATASYVSVHGPDGALAFAVNDMQVLERLAPAALAPHADAVRSAALLVLDCNLSAAALGWLFAQRGDAPVFADAVSAAKCERLRPWLGRLHTLKVNRLEARALSGLPVDSPAEVEAAARWLLGQGVQQVVVSLGAEGLYFRSTTHEGWLHALLVPVHNTTGAGDALMAGLAHSHLRHSPLPDAARFAAGCAALTLMTPSANHPDLSVALVAQCLDSHEAR